MKNSIFKITFFLLLSLQIVAQDKQELLRYGADFMKQVNAKNWTVESLIVLDENATDKTYALNFNPKGYLLVQAKNKKYLVLGFSETGTFKTENNPLLVGSKSKPRYLTIDSNEGSASKTTASNTSKLSQTALDVAPFMTDVWGGVNCVDAGGFPVYATNLYTPSHCSPGCVAISTSQILHYYQWPIKGVGNNIYSENYNSVPTIHEAFFDNTTYDWANMLDIYDGVNSTLVQQQAVGRLIKDVDVAYQMDFEPSGSTSNLNKAPAVLTNYFRFSGNYQLKTWTSFWTQMQEHMVLNRPVPIAITALATGDGHVIVANGYKEISGVPYYYINWGWWNDNNINGWYNLQGWNSGQTGYNQIDFAIFDMLPNPQITSIIPNGNGNDFVVSWETSNKLNWSEFTLQQKVDQGIWEDVATGITTKNYTISNPSGKTYQFRVQAKVDGLYYTNYYSEIEVYTINGSYNGYASLGGGQNCFARQTLNNDLHFTGDYTFETWIRVNAGNQEGDVILDQNGSYALEILDVTTSDYSVKFKSLTNASDELLSSTIGTKLGVNQWHHIAISKTGNTTQLFVDGVVRDTDVTGVFNLTASNSALNFGERFRTSYTNFIIADIDQMRFSDTGRYSGNFVPDRATDFQMDANTRAYFTFQNVHKVRLKDEAYNFSVIATNSSNFVTWNFEYTATLGTETFENFSNFITVYPNPTTSYVNIAFNESPEFNSSDFTYTLYDLTGRVVSNGIVYNNLNEPTKISFEGLNKGVYILKVQGESFTATKNIIHN